MWSDHLLLVQERVPSTLQATRLLTIPSAASSMMDAWRAGLRLHKKRDVLVSLYRDNIDDFVIAKMHDLEGYTCTNMDEDGPPGVGHAFLKSLLEGGFTMSAPAAEMLVRAELILIEDGLYWKPQLHV